MSCGIKLQVRLSSLLPLAFEGAKYVQASSIWSIYLMRKRLEGSYKVINSLAMRMDQLRVSLLTFRAPRKTKSLLQSHLPKNQRDPQMDLDFLHRRSQHQLLLSEIDHSRPKATSSVKPIFTRLTTQFHLRPPSATLEKAIPTSLRIISAKKIAGQASRSLGLWRDGPTVDRWAYLRRFGTTRPRTRRRIGSISLSEGDPWHIDWATSSGNLSLLLGLATREATCEGCHA
jgi:hypothetical protein